MAYYNHPDLIKTHSGGSDLDYDLLCVPCHHENTVKPAYGYCRDCDEHLCASCFNNHLRPAPCRHHRLQDQASMPKTQELPDTVTAVDAGPADNITATCEYHTDKLLELYCEDHELLLCSICVSLNHTKPCRVDYIPNISKPCINRKRLCDTIDKFDKLVKQCETIKDEVAEDSKISNQTLTRALSDVKNYKYDIYHQIDKIEKELVSKIKVIKQQNAVKVEKLEKLCKDMVKTSKSLQDNIEHLNTFNLSNQLFIEMTKAQQVHLEYENAIKTMTCDLCVFGEYKFVPDEDVMNAFNSLKQFGVLERIHKVRVRPLKQDDIYVSTKDDVYTCLITGIVMIPPDKLVLCDSDNNCIKLVDINSKTILSQLSLGPVQLPWNVTAVPSQTVPKVAVTFRNRPLIQFLSVTNMLNKTSTIKTNGICRGICCHGDKLVLTYLLPAELEIMDLKGNVVTTIDKDPTGSGIDLFSSANYVQATSEHIYVSNLCRQEIIMLNWNGDIVTRYKNLEGPAGLVLLGDKRLLVCDQRANTVYQISADCQHKKAVQRNVKCPKAICVDDKLEKVYISVGHRDFQFCDTIVVWDI